MLRIAFSALAAATLLTFPLPAAAASPAAREPAAARITDLSAQSRRPPARIRVTPRPREGSSPYPPANPVAYPGPNARRECAARYVREARPSGTVIVPRMNCWWVRG